MNYRTLLAPVTLLAIAASLPACGLGDDANVGDTTVGANTTPGAGGADPGEPGSGGSAGAVAQPGSGGITAGAGGAGTSAGGLAAGAGGAAGGVACGSNTCAAGEECCNPSCGICTAPGGGCTKQLCQPGTGECQKDSDCTAAADYCTGCDCRALGGGESIPKCDGPGVQCFADACLNKTAVCKAGQCVIAEATPPPSCTTDADCSLHSDYCGGCACDVLGKGQSARICPGASVQCLVDPCLHKTVSCMSGACVAK